LTIRMSSFLSQLGRPHETAERKEEESFTLADAR